MRTRLRTDNGATVVRLLVALVVLQGLMLAGQWLSPAGPGVLPAACGQIPDAGALRAATVEELKSLNGKMDRLLGLLEGGNLQVKVATPDDRKEPPRPR